MHLKSSRKIVTILLLLGICHSVYLIRPSALLKRSYLRRRLLSLPAAAFNGTMRLKRQLFREDIPHHRPLTGNTYYLHAGFPHPSRWHEGPQIIGPNPNPITHHHLEHHRKPGLHDDLHNNHLNSHQQQHDHHHNHQHNHHHHHHHQNNELQHPHEPPKVQLVHTEEPHTVNIHSAIVHGGGGDLGSLVDNSLGPHHQHHHHPSPPPHHHHHDQHFQPIHPPPPYPGHVRDNILKKRPKPPKPHSDPESYGEEVDDGLFGLRDHGPPYGSPVPPTKSIPLDAIPHHQPTRKPKTIIHYHPVTVGNIINFNDDGHKSNSYGPPKHVPGEPYGFTKPLLGGEPVSYGPPKHVPGEPISHPHPHPHLLSMAEPFLTTPFKHVVGSPDFLDFPKDVQYGPPNHAPGPPIGALDLSPMLPSYGPPTKEDPAPPYSVALPVLAHLHSSDHHHHHHHHSPPRPPPRKRHRGRHHRHHSPRRNRNHLHFHHIHHGGPPPPGALGSPFFDVQPHPPPPHPPTYVVHGHVPSKFVSLHSPHFKSHAVSHHQHKSFWAL